MLYRSFVKNQKIDSKYVVIKRLQDRQTLIRQRMKKKTV